ncbi:RNA polymerase sigma factor [Gammaproteobacteria bacterium AB-CW1]|uniref:RNA polymerase sigma factor n=1 Tax=Natronospira elongata TaxID=3110268 RepID=A0AAP6JJ92_9GAMM|nr:RNA polymerase sigma factor [Gammaproteobacteria bacterium AB-CW1]
MSETQSEPDLLEGLRAGDPEAFRKAVKTYAPRMRRTASAIAGEDAADDIVQECWISVVRNIKGFEGRSALGTWLISIVANRARSHLRKTNRQDKRRREPIREESLDDLFDQRGYWKTPVSDWGSAMPEGLLESEELRNCFRIHLERLPEQQREALVLREMNGFSYDDICEALDVSPANARVLLHRARTVLFRMVDGFRETGEC